MRTINNLIKNYTSQFQAEREGVGELGGSLGVDQTLLPVFLYLLLLPSVKQVNMAQNSNASSSAWP